MPQSNPLLKYESKEKFFPFTCKAAIPFGGPYGIDREILQRFRKDALEEHNFLRERHGAPALRLSRKLNAASQQWAQKLAEKEWVLYRTGTKYGENVYLYYTKKRYRFLPGYVPPLIWYSELIYHHPELNEMNPASRNATQVLWKATRWMGISLAMSHSLRIYVVACYHPAGNVKGRFKENLRMNAELPRNFRVAKKCLEGGDKAVCPYSEVTLSSISDKQGSSVRKNQSEYTLRCDSRCEKYFSVSDQDLPPASPPPADPACYEEIGEGAAECKGHRSFSEYYFAKNPDKVFERSFACDGLTSRGEEAEMSSKPDFYIQSESRPHQDPSFVSRYELGAEIPVEKIFKIYRDVNLKPSFQDDLNLYRKRKKKSIRKLRRKFDESRKISSSYMKFDLKPNMKDLLTYGRFEGEREDSRTYRGNFDEITSRKYSSSYLELDKKTRPKIHRELDEALKPEDSMTYRKLDVEPIPKDLRTYRKFEEKPRPEDSRAYRKLDEKLSYSLPYKKQYSKYIPKDSSTYRKPKQKYRKLDDKLSRKDSSRYRKSAKMPSFVEKYMQKDDTNLEERVSRNYFSKSSGKESGIKVDEFRRRGSRSDMKPREERRRPPTRGSKLHRTGSTDGAYSLLGQIPLKESPSDLEAKHGDRESSARPAADSGTSPRDVQKIGQRDGTARRSAIVVRPDDTETASKYIYEVCNSFLTLSAYYSEHISAELPSSIITRTVDSAHSDDYFGTQTRSAARGETASDIRSNIIEDFSNPEDLSASVSAFAQPSRGYETSSEEILISKMQGEGKLESLDWSSLSFGQFKPIFAPGNIYALEDVPDQATVYSVVDARTSSQPPLYPDRIQHSSLRECHPNVAMAEDLMSPLTLGSEPPSFPSPISLPDVELSPTCLGPKQDQSFFLGGNSEYTKMLSNSEIFSKTAPESKLNFLKYAHVDAKEPADQFLCSKFSAGYAQSKSKIGARFSENSLPKSSDIYSKVEKRISELPLTEIIGSNISLSNIRLMSKISKISQDSMPISKSPQARIYSHVQPKDSSSSEILLAERSAVEFPARSKTPRISKNSHFSMSKIPSCEFPHSALSPIEPKYKISDLRSNIYKTSKLLKKCHETTSKYHQTYQNKYGQRSLADLTLDETKSKFPRTKSSISNSSSSIYYSTSSNDSTESSAEVRQVAGRRTYDTITRSGSPATFSEEDTYVKSPYYYSRNIFSDNTLDLRKEFCAPKSFKPKPISLQEVKYLLYKIYSEIVKGQGTLEENSGIPSQMDSKCQNFRAQDSATPRGSRVSEAVRQTFSKMPKMLSGINSPIDDGTPSGSPTSPASPKPSTARIFPQPSSLSEFLARLLSSQKGLSLGASEALINQACAQDTEMAEMLSLAFTPRSSLPPKTHHSSDSFLVESDISWFSSRNSTPTFSPASDEAPSRTIQRRNSSYSEHLEN